MTFLRPHLYAYLSICLPRCCLFLRSFTTSRKEILIMSTWPSSFSSSLRRMIPSTVPSMRWWVACPTALNQSSFFVCHFSVFLLFQILKNISWYTERSLTEISLGSLLILVVIRTIQFNMTRTRVSWAHPRTLCALTNIMCNQKPIRCSRTY